MKQSEQDRGSNGISADFSIALGTRDLSSYDLPNIQRSLRKGSDNERIPTYHYGATLGVVIASSLSEHCVIQSFYLIDLSRFQGTLQRVSRARNSNTSCDRPTNRTFEGRSKNPPGRRFFSSFIDRKQVQTVIQTPISSEVLGGQFLPTQGVVHSAKLVQGLVLAARQRGAKVCQTEVYKLTQNRNHVSLQTSFGSLTVRAVIVATTIWTSKLLPQFHDIVAPWREQMLAYAPTERIFTTGITADLTTAEYWRQGLDGTILLGGCNSIEESESFGAWESKTTTKVQNSIEQIFPRLFPKLTQLRIIQR